MADGTHFDGLPILTPEGKWPKDIVVTRNLEDLQLIRRSNVSIVCCLYPRPPEAEPFFAALKQDMQTMPNPNDTSYIRGPVDAESRQIDTLLFDAKVGTSGMANWLASSFWTPRPDMGAESPAVQAAALYMHSALVAIRHATRDQYSSHLNFMYNQLDSPTRYDTHIDETVAIRATITDDVGLPIPLRQKHMRKFIRAATRNSDASDERRLIGNYLSPREYARAPSHAIVMWRGGRLPKAGPHVADQLQGRLIVQIDSQHPRLNPAWSMFNHWKQLTQSVTEFIRF